MPLLLITLLILAVASLYALVHAVAHAEEGYEDATGYHALNQSNRASTPSMATRSGTQASTGDAGNPWDQVNGSSCPWSFNPDFRSVGHDNISGHHA